MPLLLFAYFAAEVLAFIGVAKLIGVGWALLAVLGLMVVGGFAASMSLRSALVRATRGQSSVSKLAGDSALLMAAWVLAVVPGFVTSALGLFMVLPPTRAVMRTGLTMKAQRSLERFGMRAYEASPVAKMRTNYGSFTPPTQPGQTDQSNEIIDADELERMYRRESFDTKRPGTSHGGQPPEDSA